MPDSAGLTMAPWVYPSGTLSAPGYDIELRPGTRSWTHTGLGVLTLAPGVKTTVDRAEHESIVVPLTGSVRVTATLADGSTEHAQLAGRASVFAGPTDVCYVPAAARLVLVSTASARVALCWAPTARESTAPFRHLRREEVPVELRGAGRASREVRNFGTPAVLDADSIIACEVVTPAGNWSSYPPHKHDEERPGVETELEEIYYFEIAAETPQGSGRMPQPSDPLGYHRVYGTADRPIDVIAEVRSGDVVLVPHGWHGPSMAPPGYDLYYLNVMAGPGAERAWLIRDDPAHGWVRDTWADQEVDPRLPFGAAGPASATTGPVSGAADPAPGTSAVTGMQPPDASEGDDR